MRSRRPRPARWWSATTTAPVVTCTVAAVQENGIEVTIGGDSDMRAFIRRSDLARDRGDQRPERFAVGDKVDAMITGVDRATRKITLSIKQLEITEEKAAVAEFGSSASGASLGDILGAAMRAKEASDDKAKKSKKKPGPGPA